jgi:hypothetical protein
VVSLPTRLVRDTTNRVLRSLPTQSLLSCAFCQVALMSFSLTTGRETFSQLHLALHFATHDLS